MEITIENKADSADRVGIRIPDWADDFVLTVDGQEQRLPIERGYVFVSVPGGAKCTVTVKFKVEIHRYYANTSVSEDMGKTAIGRGPFIYCLESVDNGEQLHDLSLPTDSEFEYKWEDNLLEGVGTISTKGVRFFSKDNNLYSQCPPSSETVPLKFIPYYAWANRGENEMTVWIRENK